MLNLRQHFLPVLHFNINTQENNYQTIDLLKPSYSRSTLKPIRTKTYTLIFG